MKKFAVVVVCVVAVLAFSVFTAAASELLLAGSTTVQKRVLEPSIGAIEAETGIKVKVLGINSGRGFSELRQGKIRASISSSPLDLLLQKAGLADDGTYVEHVIVKDNIVPLVHMENQVTELSWQQLSDINTGKVTNWSEVGGTDRKIIVVTSQPTAATRIVFQKMVMKKDPYATGARVVRSTRQEVDYVSKFKGGIGAVSKGFVLMNPGKVKVLGTRKISRPLSIITKGKPDPDVQSVITYLRTPEAQKLFR